MKPQIIFYPIGNADSCLIKLENKILLYDFADTENNEHCKLPDWIREDLGDKDTIDVVAFTHSDQDHVKGAKNFFHMDYCKSYQGENRIKINELWVPVNMITDTDPNEDESAGVLRREAQHRLKESYGIKVFSRSEKLENWLKNKGLSLEERSSCIADSAELVPGLSLNEDCIEVFAHSPLSSTDDEEINDRNTNSLVHRLMIRSEGKEFSVLMCADAVQKTLDRAVQAAKENDQEETLEWDILKVPHHSSYLSLNAEEKGTSKTIPSEDVKWLLEKGKTNSRAVSSSNPIPAGDSDQPPHKQAFNTYKDHTTPITTMDQPKKRTVIEFGSCGHTLLKNTAAAGFSVAPSSKATNRFG